MTDVNTQTVSEWQFTDPWLLAPHSATHPIGTSEELSLVLFISTLVILLVAEKWRPCLTVDASTVRHSYFTNLTTFLFNDLTLSLCQVPLLYVIAANHAGTGLLGNLGEGFAQGTAAFVLLDLTMYAWHVACHHCNALWLFHKVHHSDRSLNVTTALRYHVGELFLEIGVRSAFILMTGIKLETFFICQGVMMLFILLQHSNIRLPGENGLASVFIVPALHRRHHSTVRHEHDSNYGAVFSLWDRLFATLDQRQPSAIGLQDVGEQGFFDLLKAGLSSGARTTPEWPLFKPLIGQPVKTDSEFSESLLPEDNDA